MDEVLQKLITELDFPEEELEHAALHQAALFERAARLYIHAMRRHLQIKAELQEKESRVSLAFRKQAAEEAEAKGKGRAASEGQIAARVKATKVIGELYVKLNQAEADEEYLRLLLDAYKMRRDAIRVLADLKRVDMGEAVIKAKEVEVGHAAQEIVEELNKKYPGGAK